MFILLHLQSMGSQAIVKVMKELQYGKWTSSLAHPLIKSTIKTIKMIKGLTNMPRPWRVG